MDGASEVALQRAESRPPCSLTNLHPLQVTICFAVLPAHPLSSFPPILSPLLAHPLSSCLKGAAHRLYLIDQERLRPVGAPGGGLHRFAVMGTTGNVYDVTIGCHSSCTW